MSKGISLGNFSGDGNFVQQVEAYSSSRYSLFLDGDFGGGAVTVLGSADGVNYAAVMLTDPAEGATHTAISISLNPGLYTFTALCAFLKVVMTGSTGPDLDVTLFPEPRS
jgi:hypothetical protein